MSAATDFAQLQKLSPQEAVSWLVARGQLTRTYAWQDVFQDEHGHQFTVSRLTRLDLLQALHDAIVKSVQGDLSRTDWMKDSEQLLRDAGWWGVKAVTDPMDGDIKLTKFDSARLRLIFDTNTRQAYATGLWQRVERTKRTHPYVRYITRQDERVRASHRAWDNLVLPVDDPFWRQHWPPNGWRCRCRVMPMSQRDYDKGYTLSRPDAETDAGASLVRKPLNKQAPEVELQDYVNPRTGEVTQVPLGVDPGFAYNPGQARQQALQQLVASKLQGADPRLADAARRAGFSED
ncbi:phage head morphogenesis protein [Paracidovorax valerianellae]|uniref:Phage putative head morphogenesis protein, SPP1 gp7 family n=1 Tax=Paracidovorax valerianellae TaxID=187868 RepID=A0A1G7EJQ2_9BURK|nr:phage minor head protein [Paracidovorax valerianellae]MDA8446377.1 phage minor head protein [Paracidovorax valerianellae]SDE63665.1 phage putative head morphogenesis protein, SPP1 gp7 family [Paracidovorax valerianellae]